MTELNQPPPPQPQPPTVPILAPPGALTTFHASDQPCLYVEFTAGRRGAGAIDCLTCGTPIHQRVAHSEPGASDDPTLPWYDGHGETGDVQPTRHEHEPAHEIGPTFGPVASVQLTYDTCRVDGETLAVWNRARGDWILDTAAGEYAGHAYSDIAIAPAHFPDATPTLSDSGAPCSGPVPPETPPRAPRRNSPTGAVAPTPRPDA